MSDFDKFAKDLSKQMEDLEKEMQNKGSEFFEKGIAKLLGEFPDLKKISWNQYTPYFNDGDECIFRVRDYSLTINGYGEDDEDFDDEDLDENGKAPDEPEWITACHKKCAKLLNSIPSRVMQSVFGDHVNVTIKRSENGFKSTTEHYDHE